MRLSTKIWRRLSGKSFLIGATTFLAVLAFTVTGVTTSMQGLDANVAAEVGGQTVSMRALEAQMRRMGRGNPADEAERLANIQNALNSLIQAKVVVEQANRIGWEANDIEVANWIRNLSVFQDEETQKFDKKKYQDYLRASGLSELDLFQDGRDSVSSQKYATMLSLDSYLPEALVKEYAERNGTEFTLEKVEIKPSDTALKQAIDKKAEEYLANSENAEALQKAYDERKEEFNKAAQTKVSTLLVAHKEAQQAQGEALQREKDAAKQMAEDFLKRLQAGEDFAQVSNELNDDFTAKAAQGDLGFVDEKTLDPASLEATQSLAKNGELSGVVDTPFGFRILKRTGHQAAQSRSLEDVKAELAEDLVKAGVTDELKNELKAAVEEALPQGGEAIDAVLQKNQLSWSKIAEPVTAETRFVPEIGIGGPVIRGAFSLNEPGDISSELVGVSGRDFLLKLVKRVQKEVDAAAIEETRNLLVSQNRQSFAVEARRNLFDMFSADGEIKRNAVLFRSQGQ